MTDIGKWYMRLLLALASAFLWLHLLVSFLTNFFFRAEGFLFIQFNLVYLAAYFVPHYVDENIFRALFAAFFLISIISPLIWPRIFIWPAIIINLFTFVGNIDLLWRYYERSLLPWPTSSYDPIYKYYWIVERGTFIFFSALFVILLLPSALKIIPANNPR